MVIIRCLGGLKLYLAETLTYLQLAIDMEEDMRSWMRLKAFYDFNRSLPGKGKAEIQPQPYESKMVKL